MHNNPILLQPQGCLIQMLNISHSGLKSFPIFFIPSIKKIYVPCPLPYLEYL